MNLQDYQQTAHDSVIDWVQVQIDCEEGEGLEPKEAT